MSAIHLADIDLVTWTMPHRGWGWLTGVLTLPEDEQIVAFRQSLRHARRVGDLAVELDPEQPHTELLLPLMVGEALEQHVRALEVRTALTRVGPLFGAPRYGLRLDVEGLTMALTWSGERPDAPMHALHGWLEATVTAAIEARSSG